jgi:nicotinamide-nucleotide amidase
MTAPTDAGLATLAATLGTNLAAGGLTLATAESCTGGWIAKACTDVPGSSGWFAGGVVAYSNECKAALLDVDRAVLARHGAVSEEVVSAMARGVLDRLQADLAVAVSGVAGPAGGSEEKPVGTVWFGWARRDAAGAVQVESSCAWFPGDRESIRRQAVQRALLGLMDG